MRTISASEMRAINRSAILELIRRNGPISQTSIGEQLDVSMPTVFRIVEDLQKEGFVRPNQCKEWSGGRKRSLLEFNGDQHLIVGVDLGGTKIYGAAADFNGKVLFENNFDQHHTSGEESYHLLCLFLETLLDFARQTGKNIQGIGVAVPGITRPETGIVELAPGLQWTHFPLKQRLTEHFKLPIVVENDVNLAALGELWFGGISEINNLVLITIGTGIGAGIVIDGMIYPGVHRMAGEIGYFLPDRSDLDRQYPGFGALEQLTSGTGIAQRARELLRDQWPPDKLDNLTSEDVFSAARNRQAWAQQILAETVDYLAQAIAAVALCFDPDVILLGGGVSRSADLLIEPVLRRLEGVMPFQPRLEASKLGYRAAVMGTIIQLLRIATNYYALYKFS